jgi:voltage-gated potassium channel
MSPSVSEGLFPLNLRRLIYKQLYQRSWEHEGLSVLNKLIFTVICLSVFLVIIETEKPFYLEYKDLFRTLDFTAGCFFAIEYALRLWSVGERKKYRGLVGRLKYMMTPYALIDLLVIVPFFVTSSSNLFVARFIRLFRILAIAKAARYSQAFDLVREAVFSRRHELIFSLILTCIVLLGASTIMWVVEPDEQFRSIPRALWWGIITLTTVGYGDVYPTTVLGKVISGVTALAGIGLIAMPAGILAAAFGDAINRHKHKMDKRRSNQSSRYKRLQRRHAERENRNHEHDSDISADRSPTGKHVVLHESTGATEVVCESCGHDRFVFRPRRGTADGAHDDGEFSEDFSPTGANQRLRYDDEDISETGETTASYSPVQSFLSALVDRNPRR